MSPRRRPLGRSTSIELKARGLQADIRAVDAAERKEILSRYMDHSRRFEAAALRALERYRYKPKVVDGKEVKMYGVQQKLSFTLEE